MSLRNVTDPTAATSALEAWLRTHVAAGQEVTVDGAALSSESGLSNETLLFTALWAGGSHRLVARILPRGPGIFSVYDLRAEHAVMHAVSSHTAVPAPRVLGREDDPDVLGAPFLLMEYVEGLTLADDPPFTAAGWMLDLTPETRARLNDNALAVLAELHAADWTQLGLPALHPVGLDEYVAGLAEFLAWATTEPNPVIEAGLAWLRAHRPPRPSAPCLIWGDARLGNFLFTRDGTVTAALDWENAQVAVPEIDLGWWLFLLRHHTEGIGAPLPSGMLSPDATVARYEELVGHAVEDVAYYEALAGVRLSIMMARAATMMVEAGMLAPDSLMATNNPATELLAGIIGFSRPTGVTETFIGRR